MDTLPPTKHITPKVGVLMTADAFYYDNFHMDVVSTVRVDEKRLLDALSPSVNVIYPGICTNAKDAEHATKLFKDEDIDLLLMAQLVYTFDPTPLGVLDKIRNVPLVILYQQGTETIPKDFPLNTYIRSWGTVGTTQITGTLSRRQPDRDWKLVVGHTSDPAVIDRLVQYARGAAVSRSLVGARVSYLPGPCDGMSDVWADDSELMRIFGVDVLRTPVSKLEEAAKSVSDKDIQMELAIMKEQMSLDKGLAVDEMDNEARLAIALRKLAFNENLDAFAILLWPEIGQKLLAFPYYGLSRLADYSYPYGEEGDLNAAITSLILTRIAGAPAQYLEFHQYDKSTNVLLSGHNCHAPLSFAHPDHKPKLKPMIYGDMYPLIGQHKLGASVEMTSKPGIVTIASLGVGRKGYHLRVTEAEVLDESPRPLSMPHVFLKVPLPIFEYIEKVLLLGGGHHWLMVYGHHYHALEMLGKCLGLEVIRI